MKIVELDITYKAFFALLRAGLWNRKPESDCFPLSPEVWKRVYTLAHKQTVQGIVYDGIIRLSDNHFPPRDLLLKWVVVVNAIEDRNKQMNKVAGELYEVFTKNNITSLLLKGQGVAAHYDHPLHRECGDIDWFFPDKQNFDRANKLIAKSGIKIKKQALFSKFYIWRGIVVEHHCRMPDIDNPFLIPYLKRLLQQEYEHSACLNLNEQMIRLPSPLLTHLSVNTHIMKHVFASGVGLRQLCDSARVCYAYHHKIEAETLKKVYGKLGIYHWVQLLNSLLVNYLEMPEEYASVPLAPQQKADWMIRDILQSGNFGFYGGPCSKSTDVPQMKKKFYHVIERLIRYVRYVRYTPSEACWNPIVVIYSHIRNGFIR